LNVETYNKPENGVVVEPIHATFIDGMFKVSSILASRNVSAVTWIFIGSTIGGMDQHEVEELFAGLRQCIGPSQRLIMGVDGPHGPLKSLEKLERAYNDSSGMNAKLGLHALAAVAAETSLDFDVSKWHFRAKYDLNSRVVVCGIRPVEPQVVADSKTKEHFRTFGMDDVIEVHRARKISLSDLRAMAPGFQIARSWVHKNEYMMVEMKLQSK
jgi:uncharacterized SAM-dependent methyltransferase